VSPGNLPTPADRFVGREHDLETVARALASARLVTLTGVGGVGKSRLALEAAAQLGPAFPDGGWQCELSPVTANRDVVHALASALGLAQQEGLSADEGVLRYLRARRLLLVLDNCEHVLDGVAKLLTELLARCPYVAVLATSRERLAVGGEHVVAVEPLAVPAPGTDVFPTAVPPSAVELFCVRAGAARGSFELTSANAAAVAEICRRLDGVPLALELAAARVATLGVRDIVARLNERFWLLRGGSRQGPTRSHTLRATVDWSYDMLSEPQQRVFHRLSVFAGRFPLEAAQAVCNDDQLPASDVADAVLALADKSMLVVEMTAERTRYRLLETLREYGRGKLHESGEAAETLRRHAGYFVTQAEQAAQGLLGPDEARSVAALYSAFDDLRAAYRWCLDRGEADLAVRLVTALHWYTHWRRRAEVYVWADETLPLASSHPGFPAVCATAAGGAWQRGDRQRAGELSKLGVAAAGADPVRRLPLHILADVPMLEGRLDEAADLYEQALAAAREAGDDYHASLISGNAAFVRGYSGDPVRAARALSVARELSQACGNPTAQAWAMYVAGELRLLEDDPVPAMELLDACLELARAVDNRFLVGVALVSVSSLRGRHGEPGEAIRTFLEVIRLWQSVGNWSQQWTTLRNVIELFVRLGVDRPAAVLLGALQVALTAAPPFGADAERLVYARQTLTSRLGARPFAAAIAEGEAMTPEVVIGHACVALGQALATWRDRGGAWAR
jgi:predicted ATPase